MVQYPDDYSFKRWLLSALRPSLQKEVLQRGITAESSGIQEILEKFKDIKDLSQYDIRSRILQEEPVLHQSAYKPAPRASKQMPSTNHKPAGFMNRSNKSATGSKPPIQTKATSVLSHVPTITGTNTPPEEGELRCYECGQKGHIKPQCPKLKGKQRVARMQFEEIVKEDSQTDIPLTGVPNDTEDVDTILREGEDLNDYSVQGKEEEDHPKYNWDEQAYQTNLIHFINEDKVIDTQMHIAAGAIENMVEPVYDHHTYMKDHARPSCKCEDYRAIFVFWEIGGIKAHCLIDSGCEGIMISPELPRAAKIRTFTLEKPIIQLAVTGSKSVINYGTNTTININGNELKEYFDVVNIDYYNAILGTQL